MHATTSRISPVITVDGHGVVSHAGTVLLGELAERTGLRAGFAEATNGLRRRRAGHDPGRVLVDIAVAIADGAETITDLQALADQPELHGPVASTATAWRVLAGADDLMLTGLRRARAAARERAWLARAELTGTTLPPSRAAGRDIHAVVIDIDATLVTCHSEKEGAAATFKHGFGYHPIIAYLDNTNEALAAILRPGNAGSNTAADHIVVLDQALGQLPDAARSQRIVVRTDGAGFSHAWVDHLTAGGFEYSTGYSVTEAAQTAISLVPAWAWTPAVSTGGGHRDGADIAEVTKLVDLTGWPDGMRVLVRRERPHPGAQLDAFEHRDGYRYQAIATNTRVGQLAFLDARHRAHARVEDRIRTGKDTGIGRFPSRAMAINTVWLELALTAADLLAWTQTTLLDGNLATAEPKALRYRLLHCAARITRGQRKVYLRLAAHWPWATALAEAFQRLRQVLMPLIA